MANKTIKPLESYGPASDMEIVHRGMAVVTKLTGNLNFTNLPVDLVILKADIDTFSVLIAESQDGSKRVIAKKNKQREVVVQKLRLLGRHVEVHCNNDMAVFLTSGFEPASTTRARLAQLSQNIRSMDHGDNSGQVVIRLNRIVDAAAYDLRYGALAADGAVPSEWMTETVARVKSPVTISGLKPGTLYAFQVRTLRITGGHSDWSDSVTLMAI